MSQHAELLSSPGNFAVVQLPNRQFPGVVIQGDTLNAFRRQLSRMGQLLQANQLSELAAEIADLQEQLQNSLHHYEQVCAAYGRDLPYVIE